MQQKQKGFTIVELLLVIVVIGILAAISVVAYNGVTRSAAEATLKSDLRNVQNQLEVARNGEIYPANAAGIQLSEGTSLSYSSEGSTYCVSVSSSATPTTYFVDSVTRVIAEGECPSSAGLFMVAAATSHTCAVADGTTYCWGAGSSGQLGNGALLQSTAPVAVTSSGALAGRTITDLSGSGAHTCAVADGAAFCWGSGGSGRLGDNTTSNSPVPVAVSTSGVLAGRTVSGIAGGGSHTCAVADAAAYCWGLNSSGGQLGNNSLINSSVPVAVSTAGVLAGRSVSSVSTGSQFSCAVADSAAFCWGINGTGQLGNNSLTSSSVPVAVSTSGVLAGRTVTALSAGSSHSCVIADGLAFCWGQNTQGRLGNNTVINSSVPVAVSTAGVLSGRTVTHISSGVEHTCAIADGAAYCWGRNNYGQLGNNSVTNSSVPVAVSVGGVLAGRTVTSISAGFEHTCAIADDTLYCWGRNLNGQLGDSTTTNSSVPVSVSPLPAL